MCRPSNGGHGTTNGRRRSVIGNGLGARLGKVRVGIKGSGADGSRAPTDIVEDNTGYSVLRESRQEPHGGGSPQCGGGSDRFVHPVHLDPVKGRIGPVKVDGGSGKGSCKGR